VGIVFTAPARDCHDLVAEGYPLVKSDTSNER
jgi:hypothetical protein